MTMPSHSEFTTDGSSDTYKLIACEVCGSKLVPSELNLGQQAMCDDLVKVNDPRVCKRYPIEISLCPTCLTAHQVHRIKKETLFPVDYHYRPRFTKDVLDGMAGLVDETEETFGSVAGKCVVDVGCNDGSLLTIFKQRGARTAGIEPTDAAVEAEASGHQIVQGYLTPQAATELLCKVGHPDIITFTNVFAHIESLADAIESVKALAKEETIVIIENHYLGAVFDLFQFDTFYHEHPRTYSRKSFEFIARAMGGDLLNVTFPSRYGGNIRVAIGNLGRTVCHSPKPSVVESLEREKEFPARLREMQEKVLVWQATTQQQLDDFRVKGKRIHGKSFPGRAAILAHLLEVNCQDQPLVYEKPGSLKIGHYMPGTRIEIVSDERWINGSDVPDAMLIWAWHISDEVARYIRAQGFQGKLYRPLPSFQEVDTVS